MKSLDDTYDRTGGVLAESRRVAGGLALAGAGGLGILVAMGLVAVGGDSTSAQLYAGIAAGLGIPGLLLGVVVVLPASLRVRLGVVAGTALTVGGVGLFWYAYPARWTQTADPLAFETLMLYGVGCAIAFLFVFTAIASFRRRNNPQGTVQLEVIRQGQTETVRVSRDRYSQLVGDGGDAESVIREIEDR